MRTAIDLSPLMRSSIGFDRLIDLLEDHDPLAAGDNYPPYNIERMGENSYRVTLAIAGFSPEEITVTAQQNTLTVEGRKEAPKDARFLHQGIAVRPFRRTFDLADCVQVKSATFDGGLLKIELVREVPEAMRPRRIAIQREQPKLEKQAA